MVLVLNDGDTDTIQCGDGRDVVIHVGQRVDPLDRHRSCEKIVTDIDEVNPLQYPPIPPIFFAMSPEAEEEVEASKRRQAFRQMLTELRASTR